MGAHLHGMQGVAGSTPVSEFTRALVQTDPICVKHIMPVQAEFSLTKSKDGDLPVILANAQRVCSLAAGARFAVQCRRLGVGYDYDAKDVEVFIGSYFEDKGAVPCFSDVAIAAEAGQKIISLYLFEDSGFLGFSTIEENLNEHCDEYRVFSRQAREVNRAEFKLIEALRKFRLNLPAGRALDLGAAPGGWTKVLAEAGMQVVAVDPAELSEKVARLATVTHIKARAEDYLGEGDFDLLVNDMNIDPEASARLMVRMAPFLRSGAYALMTVKLVIRNPDRLLNNITPILTSAFDLIKVKNLFHNRFELTVLLRRKANT